MSEKEIQSTIKEIQSAGKKISKSKKTSHAFLIKLGVITKSGNVKRAYRDLCTPLTQD